MSVLQREHGTTSCIDATDRILGRLHTALRQLRKRHAEQVNFEGFEEELHQLFAQAEREVLGDELAGLDVDLPRVMIDGHLYHRVLRSTEAYTSAAGAVRVARTLYRCGRERAVVPLELRAGIVAGQFTPRAAKQAAWTVAHLTPQEGEELFCTLGNMRPSKSTLDRLPKQLSERWEAHREEFEAPLRAALSIPAEAVSVAVSLDGVMTPMQEGARQQKRAKGQTEGRRQRGPAGYQEVGCGTMSFHDAQGERLGTVRMARMPESKKVTLKAMLKAEIAEVLSQRPDLTLVKLADGAKDHWTYLADELPAGVEVVDFYHAAEHLKAAFEAAHGENNPKARTQTEKYRHILRAESDGVEKLIRALVHLRHRYPRRERLTTELGYFRHYRHRMRYAHMKNRYLPIGSGVVEAACKTLVTQRLKRSGMRWRHAGGQAILTLRSLVQSQRFDLGWQMLARTYRSTIELPANVVAFPRVAAKS